jgi:hypothetical protein
MLIKNVEKERHPHNSHIKYLTEHKVLELLGR